MLVRNTLQLGRLGRRLPATISRSVTQAEIEKYKNDSAALSKWLDVSVVSQKGRVFDADKSLINKTVADNFPMVKAYNLDGANVVVPDQIDAKAKLIVFSFKHYGFSLCRSWLDPFLAKYNTTTAGTGNNAVASSGAGAVAYEICFVEFGFLSMAKSMFASNIRGNIDPSQVDRTVLVFGGVRVSFMSPTSHTDDA